MVNIEAFMDAAIMDPESAHDFARAASQYLREEYHLDLHRNGSPLRKIAELTYPEELRDRKAEYAFRKLMALNRVAKEETGHYIHGFAKDLYEKIAILNEVTDALDAIRREEVEASV